MNTLYQFFAVLAFWAVISFCNGQNTADTLNANSPKLEDTSNITFHASAPPENQFAVANEVDTLIGSTKDNPTVFNKKVKVDSMVQAFVGDSLIQFMIKVDTIRTFFLNGWHKDTVNGFEGYKVKGRIENLSKKQRDSLKIVLTSQNSYIFSKWAKKAEFIPALGFQFIKGNDSFSCLMAYDCDLIQFIYGDKHSKKENCDPAHPYFKALGSTLFNEFKRNADNNPINQPEFVKKLFDD